jgi:hypothetical protein
LGFLEPGGLLGHSRGGDIDEADEISKLHAFVVVLEQGLAGFFFGRDENQEVVIVDVDLMQIFEIPVEEQSLLALIFDLEVVLFYQMHDHPFIFNYYTLLPRRPYSPRPDRARWTLFAPK